MKASDITTPEQQDGYRQATIVGGIKGTAWCAAIGVPGIYLLQTRSPAFRRLSLPFKCFGVVMLVLPVWSVTAEKAGEAYTRSQWTGVGAQELQAEERQAMQRWQGLSTTERTKEWAKQNRYPIIGGSWVAAMVGSFAWVNRNKYQSFSQKLVQARVYAQAWTVALLLVAAFASGINMESQEVGVKESDHSWQQILEQEEYMKKADAERASQMRDAAKVAAPKKGGE